MAGAVLMRPLHTVEAGVLDVAFDDTGPADGAPVLLMHGFPYDIHAHAEVAPILADRGCRAVARLLWRLWSPTWHFDEASFERSAAAFDNPDFVDVVIHSYRHRFGLVEGDPACAAIEARLAAQSVITVPTLTFDGDADGVRDAAPAAAHAHRFTRREHHILAGVGHHVPQEVPQAFAQAVLSLI